MDLRGWVGFRCELALLLELSATPKPGLVDRLHGFSETRFEHFLASASALRRWFEEAAASRGAGLGKIIYKGVEAFMEAQGGGNTHLGAWLLIAPMAAAAGASRKLPLSPGALARRTRKVLGSMGWRDTVEVFRAVRLASPGGLGKVAYLDVLREETYREIEEKRITPLEALKPYTRFEVIAREWVGGYKGVFGFGLPRFMRNLERMEGVNEAMVQTFLEILAKYLDTHILRRGGLGLARAVSGMAREVLRLGGAAREGRKALTAFDRRLRRSRRTRPGATADLLAATVAAALLTGWSP